VLNVLDPILKGFVSPTKTPSASVTGTTRITARDCRQCFAVQ